MTHITRDIMAGALEAVKMSIVCFAKQAMLL